MARPKAYLPQKKHPRKGDGLSAREVTKRVGSEMVEFAKRTLLGERPESAGEINGWDTTYSYAVLATDEYDLAKRAVLADFRANNPPESTELLGQARAGAIKQIVNTNAYRAAIVQSELLTESQDENVLARVSDSALDRVGMRAPTKTDNVHRIELSERTLEAIKLITAEAKQLANVTVDAKYSVIPGAERRETERG